MMPSALLAPPLMALTQLLKRFVPIYQLTSFRLGEAMLDLCSDAVSIVRQPLLLLVQ